MVAFNPYKTLTLTYAANTLISGTLPGGSNQYEVKNDGTITAWVTFSKGNGTAVVGTSPNVGASYPILGGESRLLLSGAADTINVISTGTGNVYATAGQGDLQGSK